MDLGLRGRAALVGGASRGMGLAIADTFAAEGADVVMCARTADVLERAAEQVRRHGTRVVARAADLSDAGELATALGEGIGELGRLDALVVNTGGPRAGRFDDLDDAAWAGAYEQTLMSAVRMVRAALPALRRSDAASVVFVASTSVREPLDGLLLSNSLRTGVAGLAKTISRELAPSIRVNTLMPGAIDTERARSLAQDNARGRSLEEAMADRARTIPLQRYGTPDEFARLAVFLSSPAASYVTGEVVACDGGALHDTA